MRGLLDAERRKLEARGFLEQARHHARSGDANAALRAAMHAITLAAGETAVQPILQAAQINHHSTGAHAPADVDPIDQIAVLLDGLDIEGATAPEHVTATSVPMFEASMVSIAMVDAALDDGSSYRCDACGGVVSVGRRQAHDEAWCPARWPPR